MKKKLEQACSFYNEHRKKLIIMRNAVIILLISSFQVFSMGSYSQTKQLYLNLKNATIKEVLSEIENQSEFYFLYNSELIDVTRKVVIEAKGEKVSEVLARLFTQNDVNFLIKDRYIVLSPVVGNNNTLEQPKTLTGKVTDSFGAPLPGVSVVVKGTTTGTISDSNGNYSLSNVPENAILQFSFLGMKGQEVAVSGKSAINVQLQEESIGIEEVVAVGYGTQRKGELTVSVSQVRGEQIQSIPKTSFMETLGGRAAGVDVVSASGAPGAGSNIRIRGANSINSNASPLYVIDGFPVAVSSGDLFEPSRLGVSGDQTDVNAMINPNDIESIEILKDAAATSIYGARGSNGVILITTKSGKRGKSNISLDASTGIQTIAKQYELMNSTQFSQYLYDAYQGSLNMATLAYNPAEKLAIPTEYNTNWLNEILQTGVIQDYNLSFSGATENSNYSGSVGYLDNQGIIKSNSFKRYSARLNAESKAINGRLRFGINANLSYVDEKNISSSSVYNAAMTMAPNYPVFYPAGTEYAGYYTSPDAKPIYTVLWGSNYGVGSSTALTQQNPFYQTNVAKTPINQARAIVNSFLSVEPIKGLVLKTSAGTDLNYSKMKYLIQSEGPYRPTGGSLEHKQEQTYSWLIENTATYSHSLGKHSFTVLLGQSAQKFYAEGLGFAAEEASSGKNFVSNNPFFVDGWYFNNGVNDHLTDTHKYATVADWTVASYWGRLNYTFADKYLLTATVRKDGSSKFGKDSKWGVFPGVSAAWIISNENFFNLSYFDQLKLRASWGVNGNGNISSYQSQSLLSSVPAYVVGQIVTGKRTYVEALTDPGLKWESTRMVDFGFDGTLFNRITVTSDVYWNKTSDLLYPFAIPESTGFSSIRTTNIGSINQFGFEFSISGDVIKAPQKDGFSWHATLNLDHMKGKITELPAKVKWVGDNIRSYVNGTIGQIYGYQVDGIYNTPEEIADPNNPYKLASVGDYKYHDYGSIDAKGQFVMVPDNNITAADRVNLGNVNPIVSIGFNNTFAYRNFDLNLLFRGSIGNKIYNAAKRNLLNTNGRANTLAEAVNRWTPENHSQTIQAANSNRKDPTGSSPLSIFVEDGSYLRLSSLTLGYTLPVLQKNIGLQNFRVYATASNLFVLTGYSGLDPEVGGGDVLVPRGIDTSLYPKTRTFSLGLQVKF